MIVFNLSLDFTKFFKGDKGANKVKLTIFYYTCITKELKMKYFIKHYSKSSHKHSSSNFPIFCTGWLSMLPILYIDKRGILCRQPVWNLEKFDNEHLRIHKMLAFSINCRLSPFCQTRGILGRI